MACLLAEHRHGSRSAALTGWPIWNGWSGSNFRRWCTEPDCGRQAKAHGPQAESFSVGQSLALGEELPYEASGLWQPPVLAWIEVGSAHRLADLERLAAMWKACGRQYQRGYDR